LLAPVESVREEHHRIDNRQRRRRSIFYVSARCRVRIYAFQSTRPLNDRGKEDMGAGGEGVLDVIAEREGRNATNGRGHKMHPPICSPSLLPADPTLPPAHDRCYCLR